MLADPCGSIDNGLLNGRNYNSYGLTQAEFLQLSATCQIEMGVWRGEWVNNINYDERDLVEYQGSTFIAPQGAPAGIPPDLNADQPWDLVAKEGDQGPQGQQGPQGPAGVGVWQGPWEAGTVYVSGDMVEYQGSSYYADGNPVTGIAPPGSNWDLLAQKGDRGDQGIQGEDGAIGPEGPQGDQGIQGTQGEQGVKGDTGDTGPKGDTGNTGDTGQKGDKGDTGDTGAAGGGVDLQGSATVAELNLIDPGAIQPGWSWVMLDTGTITSGIVPLAVVIDDMVGAGEEGSWVNFGQIQGPQGEKGDTGDTGPKGDTGDTGETGAKGDTGDQGIQGVQGDQGVAGDDGSTGPEGPTAVSADAGNMSTLGTDSLLFTDEAIVDNKILAQTFNEHADTDLGTPAEGDVATWNSLTSKWEANKQVSPLLGVEFNYILDLPPNATPADTFCSRNDASSALTTILYFNEVDVSGTDLSIYFQDMQATDRIGLYDRGNADNFEKYTLTETPIKTGDVWTVTVTFADAGGSVLTDGKNLKVYWAKENYDDPDRMRWLDAWQPLTYQKNDVVRDGTWTMVANKETDERAAPQPVGDPFNVYAGTSPTANATVKQIIFGNRYTVVNAGWLNQFRLYTIEGNAYSVFYVEDPLSEALPHQLVTFQADSTGWRSFPIHQTLIGQGLTIDVVAIVNEPAPVPITFTGSWDYTTPKNAEVPAAGEIVHADKSSDLMRVSYLDDIGGDRGSELSALTIGDRIQFGAGQVWAIQSVTLDNTYAEYGVSPSVQESPNGVTLFTFETVTASAITSLVDPDYWLSNFTGQVKGLYIEDGSYDDIFPNSTAYGVDITVQQASVSEDWDVLATSNSSGTEGGGGDNLYVESTTAGNEVRIPKMVKMTQADFDAITPQADAVYVIVG